MHHNPNDPFKLRDQFTIVDMDFIRQRMLEQLTPYHSELLKQHFPDTVTSRTSSSTTGSVVNTAPAVKQQWWVKVPNLERLELVTIEAISGASVAVKVQGSTIGGLRSGRYERNYLKFVERHEPSLEPKPV